MLLRLRIRYVVGAVFVAGVADAVTTVIALSHGARELNPASAAMFDLVGLGPGLVFRVVWPSIATAVVLVASRRRDPFVGAVVTGAFLFLVVAWSAIAAQNVAPLVLR